MVYARRRTTLSAIMLAGHPLTVSFAANWFICCLVFCSFLVFCCGEDGDMFGANFMASVERLLEDAGYDWGDESDPEVRKTPCLSHFQLRQDYQDRLGTQTHGQLRENALNYAGQVPANLQAVSVCRSWRLAMDAGQVAAGACC